MFPRAASGYLPFSVRELTGISGEEGTKRVSRVREAPGRSGSSRTRPGRCTRTRTRSSRAGCGSSLLLMGLIELRASFGLRRVLFWPGGARTLCRAAGSQPGLPSAPRSYLLSAARSASGNLPSGQDFGRTATGKAPKSALRPAFGRPEGRLWCFPDISPAKIRPERPIYGPEALLRNIEYQLTTGFGPL